ncbi:hypothetical protein [Bradyrhizobium sp. S3.5.5]|uniref:hypothetical protein n=1 Tax=unclassified Bradyrhizobium TaxID=2631580 RepID=UPI00339A0896
MTVQKLEESFLAGRATIICLLGLLAALCCLSLFEVSKRLDYIPFHQERLFEAAAIVTAFSCAAIALFAAARFSFGYVTALSLFTMMAGFLWINTFSRYPYDHRLASFSAMASFLAFLAVAIVSPALPKRRFELSECALGRLLLGIEILALITLLAASKYNFRLVSLERIYDFRQGIDFPAPIRYAIGIALSALLPFAFASHLERRQAKRAAFTLLLMLAFYPITLSKAALFAPAFLLWLLILVSLFEARIASILSLLLPLAIGLVLTNLAPPGHAGLSEAFFKVVNIRMFAIQSSALDIYNSFFSAHPHTYFCQISFLKPVMACPYDAPLSVVMQNTYIMGYMNSSLFATEGVASVGLWLAPISALTCGAVFAFANYVSSGLPSRFILLSSGLMPQILTNTPLTTSLLTHGVVIMIALWCVTPRLISEKQPN